MASGLVRRSSGWFGPVVREWGSLIKLFVVALALLLMVLHNHILDLQGSRRDLPTRLCSTRRWFLGFVFSTLLGLATLHQFDLPLTGWLSTVVREWGKLGAIFLLTSLGLYALYEFRWLTRARRRIRSGEPLCAHCGHCVGGSGSEVCTECGCSLAVSCHVFETARPLLPAERTFTQGEWFPAQAVAKRDRHLAGRRR